MDTEFSIDFPRAYPDLGISGAFRSCPEDFVVNEVLGFEPSGEGEHVLLHIRKVGQNTHWVAQQLAQQCGLDNKAVGYCGRKDRHAVTQQWFSLYDPHRSVEQKNIAIEGVSILDTARHIRKLRPGDHAANQFEIRLRHLQYHDNQQALTSSECAALAPKIIERLQQGVPNYFGSQRFGRELSNLYAAHAWLVDKKPPPRARKSMVMSAARAYLFNQVLARRVREQSWQQSLAGDALLNNQPTAPLWGRGRLLTQDTVLNLESEVLAAFKQWCHGLEHCGLKQERRCLSLLPRSLNVECQNSDVVLHFSLPAGTFATSVLAEIASLRDAD